MSFKPWLSHHPGQRFASLTGPGGRLPLSQLTALAEGLQFVGDPAGLPDVLRYRPSTDFVYRPGDPNPIMNVHGAYPSIDSAMSGPGSLGLRRLIVDILTLGFEQGQHDGADDQAILTDSTKAWTVDEHVGKTVFDFVNGSWGLVTANTATTLTATLVGATETDWDTGDMYLIVQRASIPAAGGPWSLLGVTLDSVSQNFGILEIEDGAVLTGGPDVICDVTIQSAGSTIPWLPSDPFGTSLRMLGRAGIKAGAAAPLIRVSNGEQLAIDVWDTARIGDVFNVIDCAAGGSVKITLHDSAQLQGSALSGAGDFQIDRQSNASSADQSQPDVTGSISFQSLQLAAHAPNHNKGGTDQLRIQDLDFVPAAAGESPVVNSAASGIDFAVLTKSSFLARKASPGFLGAGEPVYIKDYNAGGWFEVEVADSLVASDARPIAGVVADAGLDDVTTGEVMVSGVVDNVDTSTAAVKDTYWVSGPGGRTTVAPQYPDLRLPFATVLTVGNPGKIYVHSTGREGDVNDLPVLNTDFLWLGVAGRPAAVNRNTIVPNSHNQTTAAIQFVDDTLTIIDTYTPPAGDWNVVWDCSILGLANNEGTFGVYVDGILNGVTRTRTLKSVEKGSVALSCRVAGLTGVEVVTIRGQASTAAGFDADGRSLTLTKINPI